MFRSNRVTRVSVFNIVNFLEVGLWCFVRDLDTKIKILLFTCISQEAVNIYC